MLLKTSAVCLLLLCYMGLFYFSHKHLPVKSTKIFTYFYLSAVLVTVFDLITLYTVNRCLPSAVNTLAHIIYLLAINLTIYLYFLYVRGLLERQIKISPHLRRIQAAPMLLTTLLILVLPIGYQSGSTTNFSTGPKVYALYACALLMNIAILYYCVRYFSMLTHEKRAVIIASVPIFLCVTILNLLFSEALLVIVYVTLTAAGLLMSSENTEKYIDNPTGMFNQYALSIVAEEYITFRQTSYCAVITMSEGETLFSSVDWGLYIPTMEQLQSYAARSMKCSLYRVSDNGFVLITSSSINAERAAMQILEYAKQKCPEEISFSYEIVSVSAYKSCDAIMSRIADICMNSVNKMAIYDYLTGVYNRNCFEHDIVQLKETQQDTLYVLIDLNNLKKTNDVMGHSAGDKLIQDAAKLLKDTAGKNGKVYRQGGDEFAVLYTASDTDDFFRRLEEARVRLNQNRIIPLSFALGSGQLLDADGMEKADQEMYQNKRAMKEARSSTY